jgi:hypothetical protein
MLKAGARPEVWRDFDPVFSPRETVAAGLYGSDQAWIAHKLGRGEAVWTPADGVHSYRNEILEGRGGLPDGARIVFFHGKHDPWDRDVWNKHAWVREFYR